MVEHRNVLAYAVLVAAMLVGVYRVESVAKENRDSICRFVVNLTERRDAQVEYRDDLEDGTRPPIPGVTIGDIQRSIDQQTATIDAFAELNCT